MLELHFNAHLCIACDKFGLRESLLKASKLVRSTGRYQVARFPEIRKGNCGLEISDSGKLATDVTLLGAE